MLVCAKCECPIFLIPGPALRRSFHCLRASHLVSLHPGVYQTGNCTCKGTRHNLLTDLFWGSRVRIVLSYTQNTSVGPGPDFPNYVDKQWGFHPPILFDAAPSGKQFGSVKTDAKSTYKVVSGWVGGCVLLCRTWQ